MISFNLRELTKLIPEYKDEDELSEEHWEMIKQSNDELFKNFVIVYEKAWNSLADHKSLMKELSCSERKKIYQSILKGIDSLAYKMIVHNDVHFGNLLFKYNPVSGER